MTVSNRTKKEFWKNRKQIQKPHGKVKTFDELSETGRNKIDENS